MGHLRFRIVVALLSVPLLALSACGSDGRVGGTDAAADDQLIPQRPLGSDRAVGVSDLEVRVAVVYEATDHDRGRPESAFEAAIDFANSQTGAADREIVAEYFAVDPTAEGAAAATCEEVADADVFAVIGEFPRGDAACYAEEHEIVTINLLDLTDDELAAAKATLLSLRVGAVRFALASVQALDQAGELDDSAVAVHTDSWRQEDVDLFVSRLNDAGADVVVTTSQEEDIVEIADARAEMDRHAVDWVTAGADTVISLDDNSAYIVDAIQRNSLPMRAVISQSNTVLLDRLRADPARTPTISVQTVLLRDMYWKQRYGVTECIQRYQSRTGDPVNVDAESSDSDNLDIVVRACGAVELFTQLADASGSSLTNHTFAAAAERLGEIRLTGMEAASVGIDKRHVQDSSQVVTDFDPAERIWVTRGEE